MRRASSPIPLADAGSLFPAATRALAVRAGVAAVVVALAVACVVAVRGTGARATSYFAAGADGVVVLDVSSSINQAGYERTARTLEALADTGQRLGLVAFSDVAYEMLPPGTSGEEVRPLLNALRVPGGAGAAGGAVPGLLVNPWSQLSGGTAISTGLTVAREMLERDAAGRGAVLLISDLNEAVTDLPAAAREIRTYRAQGIDLRIVPLFPSEESVALFTRMVGRQAFLDREELLANTRVAERRTLHGDFPFVLVAAAGLLLAALAVNEYASRRLTWSEQ